MKILREFVDGFRQYEFLRRGLEGEESYWGADIPLMLLFSSLGREIVENFENIPSEMRIRIFSLIEQGMSSDDSMLQTYVATGLLEALDGAMRRRGTKHEIFIQLGEQSQGYLVEWEKWSNGGLA